MYIYNEFYQLNGNKLELTLELVCSSSLFLSLRELLMKTDLFFVKICSLKLTTKLHHCVGKRF